MTGWDRLVFLPDFQIPYHDKRTVRNLTEFVWNYQPDHLYHVGDLIDAPEPSRWNKGMAGEYAGTLQKGIDETVEVLSDIRSGYDGPFGVKRGNHDERVQTYIRKYAPALGPLRSLEVPELLRLDGLDIDWHPGLTDVAPGWVLAHGDEGSLNRIGGGTAASLAARIGKSVVCGHTHKAAIKSAVNAPQGYNGKQAPTLWGMEVGNAMDIRKAEYLKTGAANWQQAFGILYVKRGTRTVIPSLIHIDPSGVFNVEGQFYGAKS
jgi:hypothetical protein